MIEVLQREGIYLWYYLSVLFEQIFQYWIGGILIGSAVSVFCKQRIIQIFGSLQQKHIGLVGIIPATLLGILSPVCMYGTIPIAASFSQKGMQDDLLAAFMMGSILLNPQLIVYSMALGQAAFIIRIAGAFGGGLLAGILVHLFYTERGRDFFNFSNLYAQENRDTAPNMFVRYMQNVWRNIKVTGPYFLLGISLTAAFQRYVPNQAITFVFGRNAAFASLMAAALGVPLYACGGGTIPLLFDWMARGMSLGAASAFMIAGPATKITNLGALKIVLGLRRFGLYIVFSILFAWITGVVIDIAF